MSFTFFPLLLLNSLIFEGVVPLSNYNGFLYEKFIDPLIAGIHSYISKKVPIGSTCVDACCGTGQLALKLASRCKEVTGVDLSPSVSDINLLHFVQFILYLACLICRYANISVLSLIYR